MSDDDDCEVIKDWSNSKARLEKNWANICEKYERLSKTFSCEKDDDEDESTSFEISSFLHTSSVDTKTKIASTILEGVVDRDFGFNIELQGVISDDDSDTEIEDECDEDDEIGLDEFISRTIENPVENKINEDVFSVVSCAKSCCEKSLKKCISVVGRSQTGKFVDSPDCEMKPCFVAVKPLPTPFVAKRVTSYVPGPIKTDSQKDFVFLSPTSKKRKTDDRIDPEAGDDRPTKKTPSLIESTNFITLKVPKSILNALKTRRVDDILSGFLHYERRFLKVSDDKPSDRLRPYIERGLRLENLKILQKYCPLKEFQVLYKNSPSITEFDDFTIDADLVPWKK